ncbi:MAG: hypothetical protein HKO62_03200 [Gammaproteobacteria bacterium]|nr:hypothetical protein [Gammaproteobacteria bacterium]
MLLLFATRCPLALQTGGALTGGQAFSDGGTLLVNDPAVPSFTNNVFDDDNLRVFDEQQQLVLPGNIILDVARPGATTLVIGAGSTVSSHLVVFDPAVSKDAIGFIEFDEPVLGIFRSSAGLNGGDAVLGILGVTYGVNGPGLDGPDDVMISGNRVDIDFTTVSPGDYLRVVTGPPPALGFNECEPGEQTLTGTLTGGAALTAGGVFRQICEPIGPVGDDNFQSYDVLAFQEQQSVTLTEDLVINATSVVAAGAVVSSFYVVFDPDPLTRVDAEITLPGTIVGVIEDRDELAASDFLGDASATYLNPNQRGLESGDNTSGEGTSVLELSFRAGSPGDVVRVILSATPAELPVNVCAPDDETLTGSVTGGAAAAAGGQFIELCEPIGAVGNNNYQTNDLFAFRERAGVQLEAPVTVDTGPEPTIPAGTRVTSYYVAFDPGATTDLVGTIDFPGPILGVLTGVDTLTDTDLLGNPTASYLNPSLRGLEAAEDSLTVNGNQLSVDFRASSPGDYVRVLIAAPAPATVPAVPWWMLTALLAGCALMVVRRRAGILPPR